MVDPEPTSGALRAAGLPSSRPLARLLGAFEVCAAVIGLAIGGAATYPAAVLYLGFTAFTLSGVLNRRPIQSCGCFGRDDTPHSWLHVTYNFLAVLVLGWVAATGGSAIPWDNQLLELIGYVGFAGVGVFASYLILTALPQTLAQTRTR